MTSCHKNVSTFKVEEYSSLSLIEPQLASISFQIYNESTCMYNPSTETYCINSRHKSYIQFQKQFSWRHVLVAIPICYFDVITKNALTDLTWCVTKSDKVAGGRIWPPAYLALLNCWQTSRNLVDDFISRFTAGVLCKNPYSLGDFEEGK